MKRKVGDIAIEVMEEENSKWIGYNEFGMLDEVYSRALQKGILRGIGSQGGRLNEHPLNRQQVILNALDRDDRFEKSFITIHNNAMRQVLCREFKLVTEARKKVKKE